MDLGQLLKQTYGLEDFDGNLSVPPVLIDAEQYIEMEGSLIEIQDTVEEMKESAVESSILDSDVESLESIVTTLEHQLQSGGVTRSAIAPLNIGLESITAKYGIESFGISMEDAENNPEAATLGVLGKTKQMLSALKQNILGALQKIAAGIDNIRGNISKIAVTLKKRIQAVKSNIKKDNKGGKVLKMGGMGKFLTSGSESVKPEQYLSELNASIALANDTIGLKAKADDISIFVDACVASFSKGNNGVDLKQLSAINQRVAKHCTIDNSKAGNHFKYSKPGLGGTQVSMYYIPENQIQILFDACVGYYKQNEEAKKKQGKGKVSNEAISMEMDIVSRGSSKVANVSSDVIRKVMGLVMMIGGVVNISGALAAISIVGGPVGLALAASSVVGAWGACYVGEKIFNGELSLESISMEAAQLNPKEFAILLQTYKVRKAKINSPQQVLSMNAQQVAKACDSVNQLCDDLINYSTKTPSRRQALKDLPGKVNAAMQIEDKRAKKMVNGSVGFVKNHLSSLIDFETDFALAQLNIARAAVQYAELSNRG